MTKRKAADAVLAAATPASAETRPGLSGVRIHRFEGSGRPPRTGSAAVAITVAD